MLKKFILTNYKNFKDTIEFDFDSVGGYKFNKECINNKCIFKSIIYGRNATGKTNFGKAIVDIFEVVTGRKVFNRKGKIVNADSEEEMASFLYEFKFDNDAVIYRYKKNIKNDICREELIINDIVIYEMDFENNKISNLNLEYIDVQTIQIEKYIDLIQNGFSEIEDETSARIPFLRFILNNTILKTDSVLVKLEDYVQRMRFFSVTNQIHRGMNTGIMVPFTDYLEKKDNLLDFEDFLNIMCIECKLRTIKTIEGHYELYFDCKNPIPFFENASSGTLSLVNFYRRYVATNKKPSFIYMDEFDAFYHYEMAERLVEYFKVKYENCQVILTTHNTNLMNNHLMRPDCLYILSRSGKLTALCNATERELREGHNLEKLYIGGEFERYE